MTDHAICVFHTSIISGKINVCLQIGHDHKDTPTGRWNDNERSPGGNGIFFMSDFCLSFQREMLSCV